MRSYCLLVALLVCGCTLFPPERMQWQLGAPPDNDVWTRSLDRIAFNHAPLSLVVTQLQHLANKGHRDKVAIRIADGATKKFVDGVEVTCDFKLAPLNEALVYLADAFSCQLRYRGNLVEFFVSDAPDSPDALVPALKNQETE